MAAAVEITILGVMAAVLLALFGYVLCLGERLARLEGTMNTLKGILTRREA